eukprot:c16400_g1_i2.p1 GENE.c16400_g1_i2~~c16400_g1_i2.p1  ORF type:complete len:602 (+),score=143.81 c16400_g1_i2:37-1806(+)
MVTPELVCSNESMVYYCRRLTDLGFDQMRKVDPSDLPAAAVAPIHFQGQEREVFKAFMQELHLAPWVISRAVTLGNNRASRMQLVGFGDPSGKKQAFSFHCLDPRRVVDILHESNGILVEAPVGAPAPKTRQLTELLTRSALKRLTDEQMMNILLSNDFKTRESVESLPAWLQMAVIRLLARLDKREDKTLSKIQKNTRALYQQQLDDFDALRAQIMNNMLEVLRGEPSGDQQDLSDLGESETSSNNGDGGDQAEELEDDLKSETSRKSRITIKSTLSNVSADSSNRESSGIRTSSGGFGAGAAAAAGGDPGAVKKPTTSRLKRTPETTGANTAGSGQATKQKPPMPKLVMSFRGEKKTLGGKDKKRKKPPVQPKPPAVQERQFKQRVRPLAVIADLLKSLLTQLRNDVTMSPFWINIRDFLGYTAVIKNPIDLNDVERGVKNQQYNSRGAFLKDIKLIVSNCQEFNRVENPQLLPVANKLLDICTDFISANAAAFQVAEDSMEENSGVLSTTKRLKTTPPKPASSAAAPVTSPAPAPISTSYPSAISMLHPSAHPPSIQNPNNLTNANLPPSRPPFSYNNNNNTGFFG